MESPPPEQVLGGVQPVVPSVATRKNDGRRDLQPSKEAAGTALGRQIVDSTFAVGDATRKARNKPWSAAQPDSNNAKKCYLYIT
jgi:hypothetical protein